MLAENTKKIRLPFYPYTYVRTAVMRTLLLRAGDYHKLLKMDFNEIARFLEETSYKQSIDLYAARLRGAELIETALNDNLAKTFAKLRRISSLELRTLIDEYLKRKDIEDIKTVIRAVFTKTPEEIVDKTISGAGTLPKQELLDLFRFGNIEKILKAIPFIPFEQIKYYYEQFEAEHSLSIIENALDRYYYRSVLIFTKRLPSDGEIFKNFLLTEIEIVNILTIIRLKHASADKDTILKYLILTEDEHYQKLMIKCIDSDIPTIIKLTSHFDYKNVIMAGLTSYQETGSLISLEASLYTYLLRKSIRLLHQNILSIDVILGYLFSKDMEVKNLRAIVKGKQLGVDDAFIEEQLVYLP